MQHCHVLKKLNFDLLALGSVEGVVVAGWVGVSGQNICNHVGAIVIPFKFDIKQDHVLKKLNF